MNENFKKGRLKIYLGMSAGVGKTYAMLKDAEGELKKGVDLVAGYIEPHGRKETEDLVKSFEIIDPLLISHQGLNLIEFNLELALIRKPETILVDELAHTNAPGLIHQKRWLDIQTLLDAGINVFTTLNIQHLESIAELVSAICGVKVQETIPDTVLKQADSIEVIDIPPDELIERLKAGKIYKEEKIENALNNFFKVGNLLALREILLRKAAEKIDTDVLKFRESFAIKSTWGTSNRVIVAIGPNKFAKRLIQKSIRIANSRKSALSVVYVQTPDAEKLNNEAQKLLDDAIQLAQVLGATIEKGYGSDIVAEILKIASSLNTSLIVVGKPIKTRWKEIVFGSLADDLIRRSGNVDVLLITGEADQSTNRPLIIREARTKLSGILFALLIVLVTTLTGLAIDPIVEESTIAMLYILSSVVVARSSGRTESVFASIISILAFNYFFIEPKYTFSVENPEYLSSFIVMLVVSLSIGNLITRVKLQNKFVGEREKRALNLYDTGRKINNSNTISEILNLIQSFIIKDDEIDCCIMLVENKILNLIINSKNSFELNNEEQAVAKYVLDKRRAAGNSTDILPGASALYLPIHTDKNIYGVCGIKSTSKKHHRDLLPTYELILQQAAVCIERLKLEQESEKSNLKAESESIRNIVLSSISHDFRTPLTIIKSAIEQISTDKIITNNIKDLSKLISDQCERLIRIVNNTLSLIKLEDNKLKLNLEWESIEEIIGQALEKLKPQLANRKINLKYGAEIPIIKLDAILLDQLITNIIENSLMHAPLANELNINVEQSNDNIIIKINDNGPGFASTQHLSSDTKNTNGIGLGLKLCELITKLHSGSFVTTNKVNSGAEILITLPINK